MKAKDFTGERRGSLTLIGKAYHIGGNKTRYIDARCDCGKLISVEERRLKKINSCGCDKSGERYGNLVLQGRTFDRHGNRLIKAWCDCGKKVVVPYNEVLKGHKTSCGCKDIKPKRKPSFYRCNTRPPEKMQPCWKCKKACGGCSWSKDFTPVNGWVETPTVKHNNEIEYRSYEIHSCPEFEDDGRWDAYYESEEDDG